MTEQQTREEFYIPDSRFQEFAEKIDALNAKARRKHLEGKPVEWTVLDQSTRKDEAGNTYIVHHVLLFGEMPRINGWTLVSILEHTDEGTIIRNIPGLVQEGELVKYYDKAPLCDHCQTSRRRNDTYVLRSDDGKLKQVGSACLKDFTGHDSPQKIAAMAELLALADEVGRTCAEWDGEFAGFRQQSFIPLEDYLSWVHQSIRKHGWISKGKARESYDELVATANDALYTMEYAYKHRSYGDIECPDERDKEEVKKVLAWIQNMSKEESQTSDYIHNLWVSCHGYGVPYRQIGYAASIFVGYNKAHGITFEKKEEKVSEWKGQEGQKVEFQASVVRVNYSEGQFGTCAIYTLLEEDGTVWTWFSSKDILEKEHTYKLSGKVKKHQMYRDEKQTVVTYCKVLQEVA